MAQPLLSRSDAQLAQRAIEQGWGITPDEWDEIKQAVLRLVRVDPETRGAARAWARGAALGVAMKGQNLKLAYNEAQQAKPATPAVLVQTNTVTVSPETIRGLLDLERERRSRSAPTHQVIEHVSSEVSQIAPESPRQP